MPRMEDLVRELLEEGEREEKTNERKEFLIGTDQIMVEVKQYSPVSRKVTGFLIGSVSKDEVKRAGNIVDLLNILGGAHTEDKALPLWRGLLDDAKTIAQGGGGLMMYYLKLTYTINGKEEKIMEYETNKQPRGAYKRVDDSIEKITVYVGAIGDAAYIISKILK